MPRSSSCRCPVRESRAPEQEAQLARRRRQCGDLLDDAGALIRHPHDVSPARRLREHGGKCPSMVRTHVAEDRRMEDHELGVLGRLGEQGGQILDQVARLDDGRLSPRQFDRPFESSATLVMIRPHARHEPPDRILVAHVHRVEVQSAPPDDRRDRRGKWNRTRERAPQVNGRRDVAERRRLERRSRTGRAAGRGRRWPRPR